MNLFEEYNKKFGEDFPLRDVLDFMDDKEIEKAIKECIRTGKPLKPDYEEGMIY